MPINPISMVEKNVYGAWVIYGLLGIKQYYGYTKTEAKRRYKAECEKKFFFNKQRGVLYNV